MKDIVLTNRIEIDPITADAVQGFDYAFAGESETVIKSFDPPTNYQIGLIVGASGSGKSTLLKNLFSEPKPFDWSADKSIAAHFADSEQAINRLSGVGLNSIPAWCRPYRCLSTGEKFRADMAIGMESGAVFDEFTSTVNRNVAKSCARSIERYVRKNNIQNIVFASCHSDIIDWLQPDWVYDTDRESLLSTRGRLRRPSITIEIERCERHLWSMFAHHHYLTGKLNQSTRCWVGRINNDPVCFSSSIAYPSGTVKNAWREHRTVVLPDYQGMGIGVRVSDAIAEIFISQGCRYFSKTSHPRMGEYRERSEKWRPTSKNKKSRPDYKVNRQRKEDKYGYKHINRVCYSHEFVGGASPCA